MSREGPEEVTEGSESPATGALGTEENQTGEGGEDAEEDLWPDDRSQYGRPDPEIPGTDDPGWIRMAKTFKYETVAACRDRLDNYNWRRVEAQKHAAREARERGARQPKPGLGGYSGRAYRQINVKLGLPDFEALVSLATQRDLPPSTMARTLLHGAIGRELQA